MWSEKRGVWYLLYPSGEPPDLARERHALIGRDQEVGTGDLKKIRDILRTLELSPKGTDLVVFTLKARGATAMAQNRFSVKLKKELPSILGVPDLKVFCRTGGSGNESR